MGFEGEEKNNDSTQGIYNGDVMPSQEELDEFKRATSGGVKEKPKSSSEGTDTPNQ